MSNHNDKICPLCTEEMDLTDQQLKPCECGYEICIWCWHHIMDMAEKDETEGRCPACRTPYNKEKIVSMGANCEKMVSEMNMKKKLNSQKGKNKASEARKQLSNVRVIRRNLVYIVGLPLNLADEHLLQRKEYFGQYGKVLKVSLSRAAAGAIQSFPNSTCSVYITYSKEEEAVRCIQSVHGFILEGRSLKAFFGTTKYCHVWLRNAPCSNPGCLYLHEIGSQEDSFTKDEILSAYTRVQHIIDATNGMQRRSGSILPPPAGEYGNYISAPSRKPSSTTATCASNSVSSVEAPAPNSRSTSLLAGAWWGIRTSNSQPVSVNIPCSAGTPHELKPDGCNGPVISSSPIASPSGFSLHRDTGKKFDHSEESNTTQQNSKLETLEPVRKELRTDSIITASESYPTLRVSSPINMHLCGQPLPEDKGGYTSNLPNAAKLFDLSLKSSGPALCKGPLDPTDGNNGNVLFNILSTSNAGHRQLQNSCSENFREPLTSQLPGNFENSIDEVGATNTGSDLRPGLQAEVLRIDSHEILDDLLTFNGKGLADPEVAANRSDMPDFSYTSNRSKHSNFHSSQQSISDGAIPVDVPGKFVNKKDRLRVPALGGPTMSSGKLFDTTELVNNHEYSSFFPDKDGGFLLGRSEREVASRGSDAVDDTGESGIISNILSLVFDSWDEPLTTPQHLVKLLGDTDKQQESFGVPSPLKVQNSNRSMFSFAKEDEPRSQVSNFQPSIDYVEQSFKQLPFINEPTTKIVDHEKFRSLNGFLAFNGVEADNFARNDSYLSSNKFFASKPQISAPPGFSVSNRAPPPGFTYNERTQKLLDKPAGNQVLGASSLFRNQYQALPSGNTINNGDIEFMDPAILATGKGMLPGGPNGPSVDARSSFTPQQTRFEEARLQSLLETSLPVQQNQRFTDLGAGFSSLGNAYGTPSGVIEQTLVDNLSPFSQFTRSQSRNALTSNDQWGGWNEVEGGNKLGNAELLRKERLGFNKFYSGHEDSKFCVPSSGNLYNGTFGI